MNDTAEATKPTDENRTDANVGVPAIVRPVYSQGVCEDGAAILCNGVRMTVDEVVAKLNESHAGPKRNRSQYRVGCTYCYTRDLTNGEQFWNK